MAKANVPPALLTLIDVGELEALEDEWMRLIAEKPPDVVGLAAAAQRVSAGESGDSDHAAFLLDLFDEQLKGRKAWRLRLELLRHAGPLLVGEDGSVHDEIVATLEKLYHDREILAGMLEEVGFGKATHDVKKTWEKVERIHALMPYDLGTIVAMEGRGVGRVADVNLQLSSFKVEFFTGSPLNVGFRAAPKMLDPLPEEHILRRKIEQPEEIAKLAKDDPPALLRVVLLSRGREMAAGEVRADLAGIVSDSRWASWWNAARKHPQVVVHGKGRQTYSWAESEDHALDAVWSAFEAAGPRKKIDLLRREGERDPDLASRMADNLSALAAEAVDEDPGLAFELACSLDRAGHAPDPDDPWSPASLMASSEKKVLALLDGVEDRTARETAYREVRKRREDWARVYLARLPREEETKLVEPLVAELAEDDDETTAKELGRFLDRLLVQPQKSPTAFVWFAESAAEDGELRRRNPLRLLQHLFAAVGREEFASYRVRLRALVEKGSTAALAIRDLGDDQAPAAREALHRAGYLESYERDELERVLLLRFPAIDGESQTADVLWATADSIAAKRAELDDITKKELPANRTAIQVAREMGDLRENFEYKAARQRHEYLSARATQLNGDLNRARPIDFSVVDPSKVRVGTKVKLAGANGDERVLTVLGPWESAPENGIISYESDLAQKLLGKGVGEEIEGKEGKETVAEIEVAKV
ncbi:MAG TPA: GreA/GreB family elongation factor [Thermoanaerobaculia bacterium]|nr:GreA/GreB family elongation factor [Thermoanaerobaculia bacterium]